jgi:hypothetical protein
MTNKPESGSKEERQKIADILGVPLDQIHRLDITSEGSLIEVPDKPEIEFWGSDDEEYLYYSDQDEYIESILDEPPEISDPLPEKLIVWGWARAIITDKDLSFFHPLEDVLERLDENYGSPDESTEATDAMKEAEKAFLEVIRKEYTPWVCKPVVSEEIIVADWIKKNRPDWIIGFRKEKSNGLFRNDS